MTRSGATRLITSTFVVGFYHGWLKSVNATIDCQQRQGVIRILRMAL